MFKSKEEIIQALNIVVGHCPKAASNIFSIGANKHFQVASDGSDSMSLGGGLQAIRGFFVSVRAATARILLNVQVKHTACYDEGPLAQLIPAYTQENGPNMVRLGNFLKRVRVEVTHIIRKNKKGEKIPRIKPIVALATPGDGHGLPHPPIVPRFAAGSKEVKFFLESPGNQPGITPSPSTGKAASGTGKGKGKGKSKKPEAAGPAPQGAYISVYDFFKRGGCSGIVVSQQKLSRSNVFT
jgi:hypothetical protein